MEELRRLFTDRYGALGPTHVVTAPGRINLIGEHTDYNGLPVFPMALDRRVTMLFRARKDACVRLSNMDRRYGPLDFTIELPLHPYGDGEWGNYVKAAAQELTQYCGNMAGFDAVMRSDIPVAAGLSSSSALVVAAALALIQANNVSLDRSALMDLLANAERYVGTEGGGMDQAISLGAVEGTAARIDFDPVRLTTTEVPLDWRFVVANSLVEAEKSGAARDAYNARTRECRESLSLVVEKLGLTGGVASYPELLKRAAVEPVLEAARAALSDTLRRRFTHVVTEALRVSRAERAMREADADLFGSLMSESHTSLRDDFAVSGPELDELTTIATAAGAKGARLTGAGFGGCVIALCTTDSVYGVLDALQAGFYAARGFSAAPENKLFVARPGGGARVRAL